jgi:hypothetical protein
MEVGIPDLCPLAVRDGVQSSGDPLGSGAPSRDSGTAFAKIATVCFR